MKKIALSITFILCFVHISVFSNSFEGLNLLLKISEVKTNGQEVTVESYLIEDSDNITFNDKSVLKNTIKHLRIEDNTLKIAIKESQINLSIPALVEDFEFFVESNKKRYSIRLMQFNIENKTEKKSTDGLFLKLIMEDKVNKKSFSKSYAVKNTNAVINTDFYDEIKIEVVELTNSCLKIKITTDNGDFYFSEVTNSEINYAKKDKNFAEIAINDKFYGLSFYRE